ncbi:hypothetical protein FZEAL_5223 [Fusarium zealandicum]|uniref:Zn(2)-C6 fungal-type domain-containing protein n=1 Tax=Fusarium zealandicum TaxID=1053134 RepID=A0A8H4UK97_9HYPO|nr:hypothetical protein FZEAL_5223 [Fusarium zealandicum]
MASNRPQQQSSASPDSHQNDFNSTPNTGASGASSARQGSMAIPFDRPLALTASGAPLLNPRSCVTCRRRRVRCDKTMPCSNCRRAQSDCTYPASGRAPRQMRPRDASAHAPQPLKPGSTEREADLVERLRKLENLVNELGGQADSGVSVYNVQGEGSPKTGDNISHESGIVNETAEEAKRESESRDFSKVHKKLGRLVLHDGEGTSRYVNSGFFSKLNDELDQLRNEMQTVDDDFDESEDDTSPDQSPQQNLAADSDHHSFLMGYSSADVDLAGLHPLPAHISYLWQVYLENVEPLLKVVHIPTMSRLMTKVRRQVDDLRPGDEALVFAIYYSAVTSMEAQEVQANLGASQSHYIAQFRFALEQALAKANILNTTDMAVLQSFVIYLTVVKCHDDSKFCWTLTPLCVRMAQALGLHRDGSQLRLSPFEVEMRRRLWWAVLAIDIRSAEEMGSDLTVTEKSFDTQLPSNINDADIDPSFTDPPTPRQGRSDTAVCLVRYEIIALTRRLFTVMSEMGPVDPKNVEKSLEERERMLIEVYDRIEDKFLKHAVMDEDPLFWMASLIARVIMAKIGLIIYQPVLFPGTGPDLSKEIRTRLWISTIEIVEYNHILNIDPRCRQWRWLFQSYRQWHAIAYMLLEVSRRPWTVTSERAWEATQILEYDHPMNDTSSANHTAAWMPIKRLYSKAKRHREAEITRLRADPAAARQLDLDERMKPVTERLGPVPGMETRMSELRLRWRKLFRAGDFAYSSHSQMSIIPGPAQPATLAQPGNAQVILPQTLPPNLDAAPMESSIPQSFNAFDTWQDIHSGNPGISIFYEEGGMDATNLGHTLPAGRSIASMSSIPSPAVSGAATTISSRNDHEPQTVSGSHLSAWPGEDDFQHSHNMGGLNDLLHSGALHLGDLQQMDSELDMSMEDEVEDIDWQNWHETLERLGRPVVDAPPGTGSWGGL